MLRGIPCSWSCQITSAVEELRPSDMTSVGTLCHSIFKTVAQTKDDTEAGRRIHELVLKAKGDEELETLLTPAFVRQELTDDPVKYVQQIHVPMLALIGTLDRIVPAEPYVAVMKPTLAKIPGSKLVVLDNLNHVMQTAKTGSPMEFGTLPETIAPIALQTIGDWINVTAKPIP